MRRMSFGITIFTLIILGISTLTLNEAHAWSNGGFSIDPQNPNYGTHDWIAQHALDWLPTKEKQYILDNLALYLYGTELPDNAGAADGIGDTAWHHVYFNKSAVMTENWAAFRAQWEFERALFFLNSSDPVNASKTAGIMSHYIADVTCFAHVMGANTPWGAETHHSDYESYVNSRTSNYTTAEFNSYLSFDGNLDLLSAYNATKNLAYDTTFDVDGNLTCVWMDQNYNWSNPTFRNRAGESLNLAVNSLADVLHTLYTKSTLREEKITVFPASDVGLLFDNMTEKGTTTVEKTLTGPEPPPGYIAKKYYDIKTTASYSNQIEVKIIYDIDDPQGVGREVSAEEERSLQLALWNETTLQWENITTYIDVKNNLVMGNASHLSMFGISCRNPSAESHYEFPVTVGTRTFNVSMRTNSTISAFAFNETNNTLSFEVGGSSGTKGFCNITIPSDFMWCNYPEEWIIKIDGTQAGLYNITEAANCTFIYVAYAHSTHKIEIKSASAFPEFQSFIILPLFVTATLLAALALEKKRKTRT